MKLRRSFSLLPVLLTVLAVANPTDRKPAWTQHAGNPQHTGRALGTLQRLNRILWSTPVDLAPQYSGSTLFTHYTSPFISGRGTVIVPVKTGANGDFVIKGFSSTSGKAIWSLPSDWIMPEAGWKPVCGTALVPLASTGDNYAVVTVGSGGKLIIRSDADSASAKVTTLAFFGNANYEASKSTYDASVQINTPLTVGPDNSIYFGYQVIGDTPLHLQSGIARVKLSGEAVYTSISAVTSGLSTGKVSTNCAPALSLDGRTVYFAVNSGQPYLVSAVSSTLAPKATAPLNDPITGQAANVTDQGTSAPMVGPDGHVFYGVIESPWYSNHLRGWLLHFDKDLVSAGGPGAFGWDFTPTLVAPTSVPRYTGSSKYLLFAKYNNYLEGSGDGQNMIAILDPFTTATEAISGQTAMKVVISIKGATRDGDTNGVREWCVNTAAVDDIGKYAFVSSEDGKSYKWDFRTNTLSDKIAMNAGLGQAYTPSVIGPDGRGYAISNGRLYVLGSR